MILNIILTIILTFLGGLFYRMGGAAKTGKWYDFLINTKSRDFGIPTITIALFLIWTRGHYDLTFLSLILTWGATFGAQTTYWKKKGTDAKWYNWLFTGLGYSICWIPTVLAQVIWSHSPLHCHWLGFGIRSFCVTGLTVLITSLIGKDVISENSRGWAEVMTIPLLFIG